VYAHAGENLAIHFTDSSEVVEAWMDSPTHRKNIVDAKFTEIGVGTAKGKYEGYETVYVVQLFGTPAAAPAPAPASPPPPPPVAEPTVVALAEPEAANVLAAEDTIIESTEPEIIENATSTAANVAQYLNEEVDPDVQDTTSEVATADTTSSEDVVIVETQLIATSSGLAVANIVETNLEADKAGITGMATRPHLVLQIIYGILAAVIVLLLLASIFIEWKRIHPVQVAYSVGMLGTMALLLWVHTVLIHGAVVV
jgi:hypothetical protein